MIKALKSDQHSGHLKSDHQAAIDQLEKIKARGEQSLPGAIIVGGLGALVGAGLWGAVTFLTGYQIGYMAIGVGVLVGLGVRMAGRGTSRIFGILGAALALAGCLLGNVLAFCLANVTGEIGLLFILTHMTPEIALDGFATAFQPLDVLFYILALYSGYRLSIGQKLE